MPQPMSTPTAAGMIALGVVAFLWFRNVGPSYGFGWNVGRRENARWLDQACHRSLYSQQLRAALHQVIDRRRCRCVGSTTV